MNNLPRGSQVTTALQRTTAPHWILDERLLPTRLATPLVPGWTPPPIEADDTTGSQGDTRSNGPDNIASSQGDGRFNRVNGRGVDRGVATNINSE